MPENEARTALRRPFSKTFQAGTLYGFMTISPGGKDGFIRLRNSFSVGVSHLLLTNLWFKL